MSLYSTWLIEKWIPYFELYGDATLEDFQAMLYEGRRMDSETFDFRLIHVIVNAEHVKLVPSLVKLAGGVSWFKPKNSGYFVFIIGDNVFLKFACAVTAQLMNVRYRITRTYTDGITFLNSIDSALPDLNVIPKPSPPAEP